MDARITPLIRTIDARFLTDNEQAELEKLFDDPEFSHIEAVRRSGSVICDICGKEGYKHPMIYPFYFLHLMCDGVAAKF